LLPHNLALVELVKDWAKRKQATPAQIALSWLMAEKPWIVPILGTTVMAHMVENSCSAGVRFTPAEFSSANSAGVNRDTGAAPAGRSAGLLRGGGAAEEIGSEPPDEAHHLYKEKL
jgi:diketogulonate reductase-like aldo/keto reductase